MTGLRHNTNHARCEDAWQVYIIECRDGSLYTGITCDIVRRLFQHNTGHAARYTRGRGPVILRHCEGYATRALALKREWAIKRLTRAQKQTLLSPAADLSLKAGIAGPKERYGRKGKPRKVRRGKVSGFAGPR